MPDRKLNILCVGAHPFDMMKGPGGTLIKYVKAGHVVTPVVVSDCYGYGELPLSTPYEQVPEIQREETRQVSKFLGFREPRFLHYTELELTNLENDWGAITKLADIVRELRADVVFTHWPEDQTQGFYNHGNAGILATKAVKIAAMPEHKTSLPAYESKLVLYFISNELTPAQLTWGPDLFVNVEDEMQTLHQTFRIFRTHTGLPCPTMLREYRFAPRRFYGVITGTLYAEAFKLPQFIGAQLAHNWIPDEWVSTTGRAILSNETNPELGTVAHPRLSIPVEWPEDSPIPQLTAVKR